MKFLIDAQLPKSLKQIFQKKGLDCIHTRDLELGNRTSDKDINKVSVTENRVIITKDKDFYYSHILKGEPAKLILVKFGNVSKNDLLKFFDDHLDEFVSEMEKDSLILLR